jgi:CDP-glucose 4,6-dehydratase
MLARTYGNAYGLPTRVARCGNVYGPGDTHWSRLVPGTIRAILLGLRPVLRSDGSSIRDFVHVEDVVAAYLKLGSESLQPGEAFNFSSGERLTVIEVVRTIAVASGVVVDPLITNTAVGEISEQYLDSSKARETLGWQAVRRLNESLPAIIEWYRGLLSESPDVLSEPSPLANRKAAGK